MKMRFLFCSAWLLVTCLGGLADLAGQDNARPNVIVFLSDDQGWGDFSCNGNQNLATPHIDSLASQGILFENFFVCPVCAPTRAEFLTGRYHPQSNVKGVTRGQERMDLDETTIADCLRKNGYVTAAFGKWHNGMQYPYHPCGRGFDDFYGFCSGHWGHYFSPVLEKNGELVRGDGYINDDFTSQAIKFIEEHRAQPFFVYLPYNTPHWPPQMPDPYWQRFASKEIVQRGRKGDKEDLAKTRSALAMVENIDWNVGRVLGKLDELGIADNTIVMYFNDNGPNSNRWNADLKGKKGSTDEGGVRSPLFVRWPKQIKDVGRRVQQVAGAIDLYPTLLAATGSENVGEKLLDGKNLLPIWEGRETNLGFRMLFSYWRGKGSVRTQQFRLDNKGLLFDMVDDPQQKKDISSEQPAIAALLLGSLIRFKQDMEDQMDSSTRPFSLGHPDFAYTQMPARDAQISGGLKRSSIHPNCSFVTNWTSTEERIHWPVEVIEPGRYEVQLHYTCPSESLGTQLKLTCGERELDAVISVAHDPPLQGPDQDRFKRAESAVKDFHASSMGVIQLDEGVQTLSLQAEEIPGESAVDFRLLMFRRVDDGS
ncbi:MAG: arylsulfatase [Mariniblastus sp.]|nr:arylsulfatase [Mariniblastus sp.]